MNTYTSGAGFEPGIKPVCVQAALMSQETNQYFSRFMSVSVNQPYCEQSLEQTIILLKRYSYFYKVHNYTAFQTARLLQKLVSQSVNQPINQLFKCNVSKRTKLMLELNLKQTGLCQSYKFCLQNIMLILQELTCCSLDATVGT
jgi:hypothetical protein